MNFAANVSKFCEKTKLKASNVKRRVAYLIFIVVVEKTPRDTGRAAANWRIAKGSPDLTILDAPIGGPAPTTTAEQDSMLTRVLADRNELGQFNPQQEDIYISNNLPYIVPLEGGHSLQSPPGAMVGQTIQQVQDMLARNVAL